MKDYYYILGLDKLASESEIKEAYRKLSKKFHPDLNPNDAHSEKMFKDIQEAYECLNNYQSRRQYDNQFENSTYSKTNYTEPKAESKSKPKSNKYYEVNKNGMSIAIGASLFIGFFAVKFLIENSDSSGDKENWILLSLLGAVALTTFITPFLVAMYKNHQMKWAILAGNLILGWTGLGWLACLLFAIYGKSDE